ncbi:MAG: PRC-barrel domain-containing protein [Planctomycetes bacterium]|nr:PRC-barrel domain-containing protein [Planctomycetota bacterium]
MNSRYHILILTAAAVALAAGGVCTASAQSPPVLTNASGVAAPAVSFQSSKVLIDRSVVNNNGEEIANVSDLILDRGAGRIEYVVIKTGTTFGMGGRAVAIPYGSFRWEQGDKDRFVLASTAEQLKQCPEYTPEDWKSLKDASTDDMNTTRDDKNATRDDKNALRRRLATDAQASSDPYSGNLNPATKTHISGEIMSVDRVRTSTFGEQVEITVKTTDGATKRVALGPSWYVNGASAAPMRGDKVEIDTLALPRDPNELTAGTHLKTADHELHLRDSDGTPAWALKSVVADGKTYSTPFSRYLLLSHLPGMKVDCRGNECGKVQDVIIDQRSGEIGFLSIDPNENFLGIGDTKRLIPWSVATVTYDGIVRIDASKEMVLASPETPSDLALLNNGAQGERVYKAFGVPAPKFTAPHAASSVTPSSEGAWNARGPIVTAMEANSAATFEGKVVDISDVKFGKDVTPARAMRIKMRGDNGAEETILIGPVSYMANQKAFCKAGDAVKVDACRTMIDGRKYWIARSIDCKDGRVVMIDGNNAPVWSQP